MQNLQIFKHAKRTNIQKYRKLRDSILKRAFGLKRQTFQRLPQAENGLEVGKPSFLSRRTWKSIPKYENVQRSDALRVISYNILACSNVHLELYQNLEKEDLEWSKRQPLLIK